MASFALNQLGNEQVKDLETLNFFQTLPINYVGTTGQLIPEVKYNLARGKIND